MKKLTVIENKLIPIYETDNGRKVVNARAVHDFLKVSRDFSTWITKRIEEYGFEEGIDFSTFLGESCGGRPPKEYMCTLAMGKELGMVERNQQGKQIRKYFIEVEKRFNQLIKKPETLEDLIILQAKSVKELKQKVDKQEEQIETIKSAVIHTDEDWRNWVNVQLNKIAFQNKNYRELRKHSYDILENRARCRLNARLNNLRDRLRESGATETKISQANYLDVIEDSTRLKEIYTNIVEKIVIKYSA